MRQSRLAYVLAGLAGVVLIAAVIGMSADSPDGDSGSPTSNDVPSTTPTSRARDSTVVDSPTSSSPDPSSSSSPDPSSDELPSSDGEADDGEATAGGVNTPTEGGGPGPAGSPALVAAPDGLGPIRIGMTLTEASAALEVGLPQPLYLDAEVNCGMVAPTADQLPGVLLMVDRDERILRLDISDPMYLTDLGVHVGMTGDEVQTAYGSGVVSSPHPFSDGVYLTTEPIEGPVTLDDDGNVIAPGHNIRFVVVDGAVTEYYVGERVVTSLASCA